jgi:cytochrome c-type biogenesis protein CcmH/NrfG
MLLPESWPISKPRRIRGCTTLFICVYISWLLAPCSAVGEQLAQQDENVVGPLHDPALQAWIKQDWSRLIRISTEWAAADSTSVAAWRYLGDGYFGLHAMPQAQAAYRKALELKASAELWESLGEAHLWQGIWYQSNSEHELAAHEFDQALSCMQSAQALDPDNLKVFSGIGAIRYHQQEFGLALASLEQALNQNPQDARSWHYLGMTHAANGYHSSAIPAFQAAVKLTYNPFAQLRNWLLLKRSAAAIDRTNLVAEADENLVRIARTIRGRKPDERATRNVKEGL